MKSIKFKSIQNQLIYWFLLLSVIPLIAIFIVIYFQRVNAIEATSYDKLLAIRDLKVQLLNHWIDERKGDIGVISGDFEIRGLEHIFETETKSALDIQNINIARELFKRYISYYNDYAEIFFVGANNGLVEISTKPEFEKMNKSHQSYFKVPMETGKIFISEIYYSDVTNRFEMTFSAPVYCFSHNVHMIGVLVAKIDLKNSLYPLLNNRTGLGETGETLIVNEDNMALNDLRWYDRAPLNLKITALPAVKAALGETGIIKTLAYDGKQVLAAYTYIPQTGWGFVAKQNMHELRAPVRLLIRNFIVLFILSVGVIVFIAIIISSRISQPIVSLSKVAKRIKEGDLSVRNTVESENEIGLLANEFNSMAEITQSKMKIQESIAEISNSMIGKDSMVDFGDSLLLTLLDITKSNMGAFYILNEGTMEYEHFLSVGANKEMLKPFSAEKPEGEFGNVLAKKQIYYLKNIPEETIFKFKTVAGEAIPKEMLAIPIFIENTIVAIISLVNVSAFSRECLEILEQSWISINSSYSSLLANERTRIFSEQLSRINQQLEAQTEELQEQSEELQEQAEELQATGSELQEQNKKLQQQSLVIEQANKLKSEFLSNMSHELRTPLNSILALSRVLIMQAKDKLDDDENSYLEIVERNGKNLLNLINSILDLSKIEAGKMDVLVQSVSMKTTLLNIRENMLSLADEKDLELMVEIPDDLPSIETDEMKLNQILINVVGNALKFTSIGSVVISASVEKENVLIHIKDTGIGISEDTLPSVFEEFRQADGSTSRQYQGTGLGLAIAKKMVILLGGNISVKSQLGEGSVFTLIFPLKWHKNLTNSKGVQAKQFNNNGLIQPSHNFTVQSDSTKLKKKHILIIEDNPDALMQVKTVLEKENYIVEMADSGKAALECLTLSIPDGIILDLMMPEMNGFEVLEKIRSVEQTKNIPVLILTAKDLSQAEIDFLSENTVEQFVQKGEIDIMGLLSKLGRMVMAETAENELKDFTDSEKAVAKILIIDNNPDHRIAINAFLNNKFNIIEAENIDIGVAKAEKFKPDIVLLDISLQGSSGEEYIRNFKKNQVIKNIPIIAVTAQAMFGDKERFLTAGCDAYVSKPIDQKLLIKAIEQVLNRKKNTNLESSI